jgi:alpha-galactosidase
MAKIALIGAGSGFGGRLSVDILSFPELRESTIALVDINRDAVDAVGGFVRKVIDAHGCGAKVVATTDRREALDGADYVVVAISVGGPAYDGVPYHYEIEIPAKYGVSQRVGDTVGPGGIFRTLRSAPEMLAICADMQELCPDALLINYTNPMAMLTWIVNEGTTIRNVGLCHSVQGTAHQLAGYIGAPFSEMTYWVAGINHMSWFLELKRNGEDAYPALWEALENPETFAKDTVRFEIMRHFGYFVTESTPHMSEYVPYFRKRPDLLEQYHLDYRSPSAEAPQHRRWESEERFGDEAARKAAQEGPSNEYASRIIHSIETNTLYRFNGNVANDGLIMNLEPGCCVEVPCMTDATGIRPCAIGELPPQLAGLNQSNVVVQRLVAEAVLERDLEKAFMATALDPLTAAVCSLPEIRAMFDEMVAAEERWLAPHFGGGE